MDNHKTSSAGSGGAWILFLIFLVLKLTHVINWSWWWVTAPLWGSAIIAIITIIIMVIIVHKNDKKTTKHGRKI